MTALALDAQAWPAPAVVGDVDIEQYRGELAELLTAAARQGKIPRTFRATSRSLVVDFADPVQAGWYVHKLARSDSVAWWAAVQAHSPHFAGIMPEFGRALGELRELHQAVETEIRAASALHRLKVKLFGPITPADMPQHKAAGNGAAIESAEIEIRDEC